MLHLLKKLKLYTKLIPETEHKAPISIHIKIYLWSFVDYQHLQKYFYNWNIRTLNHCFICKIGIRGNLIWKCPWQHQMPIFRHYFTHFEKMYMKKSYLLAVPMIMPFKVLKYFSSGKISFFLFACQCGKIAFKLINTHFLRDK